MTTPRDLIRDWYATLAAGHVAGALADGITIERFADGKVVESWRSMDRLALQREPSSSPGD